VKDECRARLHAEPARDVRAMVFDRADRNREHLCDLRVRVAQRDEPKDLAFAPRRFVDGSTSTTTRYFAPSG
jgi:hypothetical protein